MWDQAQVTRWERHLKTMVRSAGADDPEALAELVKLTHWLATEGIAEAAQAQNDNGYSWADIARPLGLTRYATWKKWARRDQPAPTP